MSIDKLKPTNQNRQDNVRTLQCLFLQGRTYEGKGNASVVFLSNNTLLPATVDFRGAKYYLPPRSVSILPDCKTVV